MQNAAAGADDSFGAIVSDLISLVEHVQASINLIDSAIARETSAGDPDAANVIVLDDVTPQYLKVGHALKACSVSLDTAMKSLFDAKPSASGRVAAECCIANKLFRTAERRGGTRVPALDQAAVRSTSGANACV